MLEDFFANFRMGLGKPLMVGIGISLLSACASNEPYYGHMSTASDYKTTTSVYDILVNYGKYNAYTVPKVDRERHQRCIYFALDTLNSGASCKWFGRKARGEVFVAYIDPNSCTTLYTTIWNKNKSKNFKDRACLQNNKWKFFPN